MSRSRLPQSLKQKTTRQEREQEVLFGLVECYIKTVRPVGSETLKEVGFPDLSSATIRNYFQHLESAGFLMQHHTSAGRIPTAKAFRLYAQKSLEFFYSKQWEHAANTAACDTIPSDMKEVAGVLQSIAEGLSNETNYACFLSSPRFDQDFVVDIKLVVFEAGRCLSVMLTNFGVVHTEVLHTPRKLSQHDVRKFETYFQSRLAQGAIQPEDMTAEEMELAHHLYQESMARYLVAYSNFSEEEVYRFGFSKMLAHPEFQEADRLISSLSLFENGQALRGLIRDVVRSQHVKFWIGDDLFAFLTTVPNCSVVAIPYKIGPKYVGAIGLIGPMRMPYGKVFQMLSHAQEMLSRYLTDNLYKNRIGYRSPHVTPLELDYKERGLLIMKEPKV